MSAAKDLLEKEQQSPEGAHGASLEQQKGEERVGGRAPAAAGAWQRACTGGHDVIHTCPHCREPYYNSILLAHSGSLSITQHRAEDQSEAYQSPCPMHLHCVEAHTRTF